MASQVWNSRPNRSSKSWISKSRREKIYKRDKYRCVYCREQVGKDQLSLDHLVCRKDKGKHGDNNLVTACKSCNSRRQHRPWEEFADGWTRRYIREKVLGVGHSSRESPFSRTIDKCKEIFKV